MDHPGDGGNVDARRGRDIMQGGRAAGLIFGPGTVQMTYAL